MGCGAVVVVVEGGRGMGEVVEEEEEEEEEEWVWGEWVLGFQGECIRRRCWVKRSLRLKSLKTDSESSVLVAG